jgi:hypothetical protein
MSVMNIFLIPVKCFHLPVWLMAKAVIHSLTASPNLQTSPNSKMDRKARALGTCHQITTGTKPWVVASNSVKENEINNTGTETYDPHHSRTLFVRFPYEIKDKLEVKLLHPGIEAVRFKPGIKRYHFLVINATGYIYLTELSVWYPRVS